LKRKICVQITYKVWITLPSILQRLLILRIFQRYHSCQPPIGSMPGVENHCCWRKGSSSKWYCYGRTGTTFDKYFPEIRFGYIPHNIVYFYFFGDPKGRRIHHQCGCPDCIQPNHLTMGTTKDNSDHATTTRKPHNIAEGLKTWKTWPGDHMIMLHMRQIFNLKQKDISKVIGISAGSACSRFKSIFKKKTIFASKKWEGNYIPPDSKELIGWMKIILTRIKKNPELRELFTIKDLQQMFLWSVDLDRSIAWYAAIMRD